jgi:hypothetical protein
MAYKAVKPLEFYRNTGSREIVTIQPGTILKEAPWADMSGQEKTAFKKMAKLNRQNHPNERIGFFHYDGVIRAAVFLKDILPVRGTNE